MVRASLLNCSAEELSSAQASGERTEGALGAAGFGGAWAAVWPGTAPGALLKASSNTPKPANFERAICIMVRSSLFERLRPVEILPLRRPEVAPTGECRRSRYEQKFRHRRFQGGREKRARQENLVSKSWAIPSRTRHSCSELADWRARQTVSQEPQSRSRSQCSSGLHPSGGEVEAADCRSWSWH